jgi:uncharacterized membrane protein
MDETLILVTFGDDSHAYEALAQVKNLDATGQLSLREAGVVQRSDTGLLTLADESDPDVGGGTAAGGFIGLLVGILGGPIGVLFGGAVGIVAGSIYEAGSDEETDSVLERIARNVPRGSTALVSAIGEDGVEVVDSAMHGLGGTVARYARKDVEAEVAAVDRAARKARRQARKELRRSRREAARDKVHAKLDQMRAKLHAAREKLAHH